MTCRSVCLRRLRVMWRPASLSCSLLSICSTGRSDADSGRRPLAARHDKGPTRASLMSTYYGQLVKVFWVSGNVLYHAHALNKQYTLSVKQNRNLSAAAAQEMASRLMLAALCVPPYDPQAAHLAESYGFSDTAGMAAAENVARRNRLAALLGLNTPPEREPLIAELITKGVHKAVHPELMDVYAALEVDVSPLRLAERLQPALDFLESHAELSLYATPLRRVGIFRLLQQLCRVYDVMHIDELRRVASFAPFVEVEQAVLDALKTRALALRFDHRHSCIRFQSTLFSSEGMRAQLGTLATRLASAMTMLQQPSDESKSGANLLAKREAEAVARRTVAVGEAKELMEKERESILARKRTIEERKARLSILVAEAQRTAAVATAAAAARRAAEEARKQKEEQSRREMERLRREVDAREQQALRQLKTRLEAEAAQAAGKEVVEVREAAPGAVMDNAEELLDREKILTQQHDEQVKARRTWRGRSCASAGTWTSVTGRSGRRSTSSFSTSMSGRRLTRRRRSRPPASCRLRMRGRSTRVI
eukprot:TRINITY_DN1621_c0_g1_i7.p1 TRINITY_DN1621_c0_g1~~TRINITY_DN1621_c0_g1_i7.p1  ORF type:complete len:538 (-),score=121.03 TRINITY_DN1621_c0_g1_i7:608-2221(-)